MTSSYPSTSNPIPSATRFDHSSQATLAPPSDALLARVTALIARGSYQEAANLLRTSPRNNWTANALGVCLMRCDQVAEALVIYRSLLLIPGTTIIRADADDRMRINFATALMLHGTPSGALETLADLRDLSLEPANQLRNAIRQWSRTLSWWRRLDWTLNRIDPPNSRVPIDFEPGVFSFTVHRKLSESPAKPTAPDLAA